MRHVGVALLVGRVVICRQSGGLDDSDALVRGETGAGEVDGVTRVTPGIVPTG